MAENCYDIHNGVRYPVLQKLHEIVIEIDQNIILYCIVYTIAPQITNKTRCNNKNRRRFYVGRMSVNTYVGNCILMYK